MPLSVEERTRLQARINRIPAESDDIGFEPLPVVEDVSKSDGIGFEPLVLDQNSAEVIQPEEGIPE